MYNYIILILYVNLLIKLGGRYADKPIMKKWISI